MPPENIDNELIAEHKELVDLYIHNYSTFAYLAVHWIIGMATLATFFFAILALETSSNIRQLIWLPPIIGIIGNILAYLALNRMSLQLKSLKNKGRMIENSCKEKGILIDTFEGYLVPLESGKVLADSKGSYRRLKLHERTSYIWIFYYSVSMITVLWIILLVFAFTIS